MKCTFSMDVVLINTNMLMGILGNVELCRKQVAPGQPMREWFDQITSAAERSADLTRQLLAFARKQVIARDGWPGTGPAETLVPYSTVSAI